jgi:hypothetical protein
VRQFVCCCLLLLAWCPVVRAQVELIVRVEPEAAPLLLPSGAGKGLLDDLHEGVLSVRPAFPIRPGGKSAHLPILAYVLTVADSTAFAVLRARWAAQSGVRYVQPNHRFRVDGVTATPDPYADSLSHFPVLRVPEAWQITRGIADVRIAQIDTGLWFDHPDLAGQVWVNPGEDLNDNDLYDPEDLNGLDDDGNGYVDDIRGFDFVDRTYAVEQGDYRGWDADPSEDNLEQGGRGHGTTVAGVLVAAAGNGTGIAGVAPGTRLVPLRAFGADGLGEDDDVAAAIVYAADQGVDVLNLSFGDVYESQLMHEALRYAVERGVTVVASAGNLGGDAPHYPSDFPEVISVAWLTEDGLQLNGRGTHGLGVDLGAPGSFIYTTVLPSEAVLRQGPAETDLYGRRSGSSLAAPMVAATAALLRSQQRDATPASLYRTLTATAEDIEDAGWDHRTGAGLLNPLAALQQLLPARVELTSPAHDAGVSGPQVPIVGTVLDPSFTAFRLDFAPGDGDPSTRWQEIIADQEAQVYADTLALWTVDALPEGVYTLRLQVSLRSGSQREDRRRVFLDRTPPQVTIHLLDKGLVGGDYGLWADVETDDRSTVTLHVTHQGQTQRVASDRVARRHGLVWADVTGAGGAVEVAVEARNAAGLMTVIVSQKNLPIQNIHSGLFAEAVSSIPHGYLLPAMTDFDRDGLHELVLNRYQDGWLGDSLAIYEWRGAEGTFVPVQTLAASVFPRDTGDSDGDGLRELLTQVGGATLLLEQPTPSAWPDRVAYLDTTGLANPRAEKAAFGARLTDLDADGRGELLVHNGRQWRVLEFDGLAHQEVARLENPTGVGTSEVGENEYQEPEALVADLDGDGRMNLLVGDSDGDWILYETTGDNTFAVVQTWETDRYNAGSRFALGMAASTGRRRWVTYTQNWTQITTDNEREPDIGRYFFWEATGDDTFVLVDSLAIGGMHSRHGTMTAVDFDGDGAEEWVLAHPPDLYVLDRDGELLFHRSDPATPVPGGVRSAEIAAGPLFPTSDPVLVFAAADEWLHLLRYQAAVATTPPPHWQAAHAVGAESVYLAWHSLGADSVRVLGGAVGGALNVVATTSGDALTLPTTEIRQYGLQGWFADVLSPISPLRTVRPHTSATVARVTIPGERTLALTFTENLDPATRADQFVLDDGGVAAALLLSEGGRMAVLRFEHPGAGRDTLRWHGVRDVEGTPVVPRPVAVQFPVTAPGSLIVARWDVPGPDRVRLTFNAPLDPALAVDTANYQISPAGRVVEARIASEDPAMVELQVEGQALGAVGQDVTLRLAHLRSATGIPLAPESSQLRLVQPADDLAGVYLYPNPWQASRHPPQVIVAGLPTAATVRIYTLDGRLVQTLTERGGDGGAAWDLRDRRGEATPAGIYLIQVEASGHPAVLRKLAVIR